MGGTRPKLGGCEDAPRVHQGFEGCVSLGALLRPPWFQSLIVKLCKENVIHEGIPHGSVTNWHFSRSFHFYCIVLTLVVTVQSLISNTSLHSLSSIPPSYFVSDP